MKRYRRIEITAFRRRVSLISGMPTADAGEMAVLVNDADSQDMIETGSEEGLEILINAIRILEENLQTDTSGN